MVPVPTRSLQCFKLPLSPCKLTTRRSLKWLPVNRSCPMNLPFLSSFPIPEIASQFRDFAVLLECSCKHGILLATREKKGNRLWFSPQTIPWFDCTHKTACSSAVSAPGLPDRGIIFFFKFRYEIIIGALNAHISGKQAQICAQGIKAHRQ